jgi:hypothetical protein
MEKPRNTKKYTFKLFYSIFIASVVLDSNKDKVFSCVSGKA